MKVVRTIAFGTKKQEDVEMLNYINNLENFSGFVKNLVYEHIRSGKSPEIMEYADDNKISEYQQDIKISKFRFKQIWVGMRQRCYNDNHYSYPDYGGRGISISEDWIHFDKFKSDMFDSYIEHAVKFGEKNTSIERKDVNGNYNKENCCWATPQEQSNNRRVAKRKKYLYKGEEHSLASLARLLGVSYQAMRLKVYNNEIEGIKELV